MTESDEVAGNMNPPPLADFDMALAYVRRQMPDGSETLIDNVAWAVWRRYIAAHGPAIRIQA
jgi:hypothetical protein